jgi:hypothetical protein
VKSSPARRVDQLFAVLEGHAARSSFHGCRVLGALVELPESRVVRGAVRRYRAAMCAHLASLLGASDAAKVARVAVLYDGAMAGAKMTGDAGPVLEARAMVRELVEHSAEV